MSKNRSKNGKLFEVADIRGKALIAVGSSLGWAISDVKELSRDKIKTLIARAKDNNEQFVYFKRQRKKTGVKSLGVLNPLAIEWVSKWLIKSEDKKVFSLSPDQINKDLQRFAEEAQIRTTGSVSFHAFHAWVFSSLVKAGFSEFESKYIVGKKIPLSDATYLSLEEGIKEKYKEKYDKFLNIKPTAQNGLAKDKAIRQLEHENKEHKETIDEIERYKIKNWDLVKFALHNHKDILFRLKTRKPSKRGFFIRQVVNYLDAIQRKSRETTEDHEAKGYIAYFIEEAQNCFNSRSTTRLEAEEFLTVFNESRNQKEAFYTASQRLTDFSKTIRTKQTYAIGKIPEEEQTPSIRRLEKKYAVDYSKTEPRNWNFEGKTFESPNWKQSGKPYQINKKIKLDYIDQLKPIGAPTANPENRVKPKMPFVYKFLKRLIPKTSHSLDPKPSNLEINPEYYNVYGNTEEDELDALDEEEGEDLWF
jgi:hypothetical protein